MIVFPMRRFGEKLRTLRKRQDMTLIELAQILGFTIHSNSYISLIENGKKKPSFDFVVKVADIFGVTVDQLVRDELNVE